MAHDDMVLLDRLHVRNLFSPPQRKTRTPTRVCFETNSGTSFHSLRSSSGVPSKPGTLLRCAQVIPRFLRVFYMWGIVVGSGSREVVGDADQHIVPHGRPASFMFSAVFPGRRFHRSVGR